MDHRIKQTVPTAMSFQSRVHLQYNLYYGLWVCKYKYVPRLKKLDL